MQAAPLVSAIPVPARTETAPALGRAPRSRQPNPLDMAEVATALETLYADQLRPYGRILRKRLNERAVAARSKSIDVDIKLLRSHCEACPWLSVQDEEGGDWSALFRGRPEAFIDVYSPQDVYPAELWRAASAYFEGLDDASMVLPGGRYLCAQVLAVRGLPFLAGRSLGEVCHIVQLAISQKKLLGYLNGAVVPYKRSQSMVKERCAEHQRPCSAASQGKSLLATWDSVRTCLQEILRGLAPGQGSIPLSNVKRIFRSKFHTELSETALGHAKLSELLQDARLSDICSVRLQGQGYVVVPLESSDQKAAGLPPIAPPPPQHRPNGSGAGGGSSLRERAKWIQPLSDDIVIPQTTFAHTGVPLSPSLPKEDFAALPIMTPSPSSVRRGQSLPRLLGRACGPPGCGPAGQGMPGFADGLCKVPLGNAAGGMMAQNSTPAWVKATVSTPLARTPPGLVPQTPESPTFPLLTPGTLGHMGFSVHNTFIHASAPPPTPPAGAAGRAHSLPRNMGCCSSDRTASAERSTDEEAPGTAAGTGLGDALGDAPGYASAQPFSQHDAFGAHRVVRLSELLPR